MLTCNMSQTINTRLDKLENDIKLLLCFHKKNGEAQNCTDIGDCVPVSNECSFNSFSGNRKSTSYARACSTGSSFENKSKFGDVRKCRSTCRKSDLTGGESRNDGCCKKAACLDLDFNLSKQSKVNKCDIPTTVCCKKKSLVLDTSSCECDVGKYSYNKEAAKQNECLQEEISKLKMLAIELKESNELTYNLSQEWKRKYLCLKSNNSTQNKKLDVCCKENESLLRNLQTEKDRLSQAKKTIRKYEQDLGSYACLEKKYENVVNCVNEKNEIIQTLECNLKEKDKLNSEIRRRCDELSHDLKILNETVDRLRDTNEELATDVINKCKSLEAAKNEYKCELELARKRIKTMEEAFATNQQKSSTEKKQAKRLEMQLQQCQCELQESQKRELASREAICCMKNRIEYLQAELNDIRKSCDEKVNELTCQNSCLRNQYTELMKQVDEREKYGLEKCMYIETEFKSFKSSMNVREEELKAEKGELKDLVSELTCIIENQKVRINDMIDMNNKHRQLLVAQEKTLCCKDRELCETSNECQALKNHYQDLERQMDNLKNALTTDTATAAVCNDNCSATSMCNEIAALSKLLEDKKDEIKIKDKQLDDQLNTITKLKQRIAKQDDKVASVYKQLNDSKRELNEVNNKLKQMSSDHNSLKKENDKLKMEVDSEQTLISNLERNFDLQKREWELQSQVYLREKELAVNAAKFAAQRLLETTKDFQKQTDSQIEMRNTLTNMLQEKDQKLKKALVQLSNAAFDPQDVISAVNEAVNGKNESYSTDSFRSARGASCPDICARNTMKTDPYESLRTQPTPSAPYKCENKLCTCEMRTGTACRCGYHLKTYIVNGRQETVGGCKCGLELKGPTERRDDFDYPDSYKRSKGQGRSGRYDENPDEWIFHRTDRAESPKDRSSRDSPTKPIASAEENYIDLHGNRRGVGRSDARERKPLRREGSDLEDRRHKVSVDDYPTYKSKLGTSESFEPQARSTGISDGMRDPHRHSTSHLNPLGLTPSDELFRLMQFKRSMQHIKPEDDVYDSGYRYTPKKHTGPSKKQGFTDQDKRDSPRYFNLDGLPSRASDQRDDTIGYAPSDESGKEPTDASQRYKAAAGTSLAHPKESHQKRDDYRSTPKKYDGSSKKHSSSDGSRYSNLDSISDRVSDQHDSMIARAPSDITEPRSQRSKQPESSKDDQGIQDDELDDEDMKLFFQGTHSVDNEAGNEPAYKQRHRESKEKPLEVKNLYGPNVAIKKEDTAPRKSTTKAVEQYPAASSEPKDTIRDSKRYSGADSRKPPETPKGAITNQSSPPPQPKKCKKLICFCKNHCR